MANDPTIDGLATALRAAAAEVDDFERRVAGSAVKWSREWRTSFDDELLAKLHARLSER